MPYNQNEYCEKLGLRHGQFFATYKYKNLHWVLNGVEIGFGDLMDEDIQRISEALQARDEFLGMHESYGTEFQGHNGHIPMVRIVRGGVQHHKELMKAAKK